MKDTRQSLPRDERRATRRLVSDMGGLDGNPPIDQSEYVMNDREKRIDAMKAIVQRNDDRLTSDGSRRAQEELSAADYDGLPYYDRWLVSFRRNLTELGYLSDDEIDARVAEIRARR